MSDITLTSGIRQNLLSLQQTSADLNTTQEALATGKAVNSASDNPSAYFTAQTLTDNANALSALLDQVGQSQQTISAADNGLTGVTSLLQQALSTATQAQQAATGTISYTTTTGTGTIAADSTKATSSNVSATATVSANAFSGGLTSGQTLTFAINGNTVTATYGASDTGNTFTDATGLAGILNGSQGSGALAGQTASVSNGTVVLTSSTDNHNFAIGGTGSSSLVTNVSGPLTGLTANTQSSVTVSAAAFSSGLSSGQTLVFNYNGTSVTATFGASDTGNTFADDTGLQTILNDTFGSGGNNTAAVSVAAGAVTITGTGVTQAFTVGGTGGSSNYTVTANNDSGSTFSVTNAAGNTSTFYYIANGATTNAAAGTFNDANSLVSAINSTTNNIHGTVTASAPSGDAGSLVLTSTAGSITVGGTAGAALGYGTSAYNDNFNSTLSGITQGSTLSIQVGSDTAHTLTFGTGTGQISTLAALNTALAGFSDITASVNSSGNLVLTPTSTDTVTIGGSTGAGSALSTIGLGTGTTTPTATVVTANSTRATLQANFNSLLTQINQLASDASYNGVNLLAGNNLTVDFNQSGSSNLLIAGVNDNSNGLGLNTLNGNEFQDNNQILTVIANLNAAISTVQAQTETFGTNASTITTRQSFTTNMINTLQTGASNLTAADQNQESANLLTEQTQQQLEISALSIANQANQSVLKLFG